VLQPEKLGADELKMLKELKPDLAVVMAYGHILRPEFIDAPRHGTVNFHASLLPAYRGASPIQSAIACGERETGVSLMRIVPALDAGPVADVERVPIEPHDTATEVEAKLAHACGPLLARNLAALGEGNLRFAEQDAKAATFCRKLTKTDGALDFSRPAAELAARINGLMPWPGTGVSINGAPVKFGLAEPAPQEVCHLLSDKHSGAGTVLGADDRGLLIATGQGVLRVLRLQKPGGKMLAAPEFLRGFPVAAGARLPSAPMPALVGREPFRRPSV
jgi:methionyl-tRNA formyltransferase